MNHTIIPPHPNTNSNFSSNSHYQMFNPPQYSTNFSYQIPDQSSTISPNYNQVWSFPQPVVPSAFASDQPPVPPGTDPYANSGSYWSPHVEFQAQMPFGEDPNAGSHNWVVKQAEPIRYEASIKSLNEGLSVPTAAVFPGPSNAINNISLPGQASSVGGQVICGNSGVELETKRRKILNGGASVDSVRVCTICNIVCNSQEVFNKHLFGKRHKAQASLMALDAGPYFAAVRSQFNGIWKKDPNKIKVVQSAWCEVCKINCNSNDAYIKHLTGKKHQKKLEQLGKLKNDGSASTSNGPSAATNAIIGPMENPGAKSSKGSQPKAPEEDLETKKRKVMSGGAAAGAVRTCTVCNVVCNSSAVFSSHLAGQKHAAMVKKQAEAGVAIRGP